VWPLNRGVLCEILGFIMSNNYVITVNPTKYVLSVATCFSLLNKLSSGQTHFICTKCMWPDDDLLKGSKHVAVLNSYALGGVNCYRVIINLQHKGMFGLKIHCVCHAVRLHTRTVLPLDRLSWNLTLETLLNLASQIQVLF
jgi:hypothetical protein